MDNYNSLRNIILVILLIFIIFFGSNLEFLNNFYDKKYTSFLIILIIIYSIYINFDLVYLVLALVIIIILNSNLSNMLIEKNSYIKYIKNKFGNYFGDSENFKNKDNKKDDNKLDTLRNIEKSINDLKNDNFDFKPYQTKEEKKEEVNNVIEKKEDEYNININNLQKNENKKEIEPIKESVVNLRNAFQEIENNFKNNL